MVDPEIAPDGRKTLFLTLLTDTAFDLAKSRHIEYSTHSLTSRRGIEVPFVTTEPVFGLFRSEIVGGDSPRVAHLSIKDSYKQAR